jgi:hypothetical protein
VSYDSAISFSGLYGTQMKVMSENVFNNFIKKSQTGAQWFMPVIPAVWRLTHGDWIFEANLHYIAGTFFKKMNPQKIAKNGCYSDVHQSMYCVHTWDGSPQ